MIVRGMFRRLHNESDASAGGGASDGGGGLDVSNAISANDLGLGGSDDKDGLDTGGNGDLGSGGESDSPGPTPAPPPATPAPTAAPAPTTAPAASPAPTSAPGKRVFTAEAIPETWKPELGAKWAAVDPDIRAEIAKRENDMFKGLEQYKGAAHFAKEVSTALAPMQQLLQQHNVPASVFIGELVKTHTALADARATPEQKLAFATKFLGNYGIDISKAAAAPGDDTGAYVDPEVKSLREQLTALQSRLDRDDSTKATQVRTSIANEVQAFAEDPANQYFDDVADDIAMIIRGSGGNIDVKTAYDRACWANPEVRAKLIAAQQSTAVEEARKAEEKRAADAAAAVKGRVKTIGHQGSGAAASGSMDDTMAATLKAIRERTT